MTERKMTRSEMKRQAILEAARKAFQSDGVQGTSMDKLAAMAQVSKRTVYNHFETKEALVIYLMRDMWKQMQQSIEINYDPAEALQSQLAALLHAEIEMMCCPCYIELSRVAFGYYFYHHESLEKEVERFSKAESSLYRWLDKAAADGRMKQMDIEFASTQLYNLIKGHCFWGQMMRIAEPLNAQQQKAVAEQTAALFLSHYGA